MLTAFRLPVNIHHKSKGRGGSAKREEFMSKTFRMSRRQLLASGGKTALFVTAAGIAPRLIRPGRAYAADALAPGMIGGPTGFEGSERYQYGADTPEGRGRAG